MARTKTTEQKALWQPRGAKEDSRFHEGNRHLCLAYEEEEEEISQDVYNRWTCKKAEINTSASVQFFLRNASDSVSLAGSS